LIGGVTATALVETLTAMLSEGVVATRKRERNEFDRLISSGAPLLVLFGAGNLGRQTLGCLRQDGLEPVAFADNSPERWGQVVDGLTVVAPNDAARQLGRSAKFVVTIWNDRQRFAETAHQLAGLGCADVIASPPLRWKYRSGIPPFPFFFLDLPSRVYDSTPEILQAARLWADDQSRLEYLAQLRLRFYGDLLGLPAPDPAQYAPKDLFAPDDSEVFVDCGAFNGDTVEAFIRAWDNRFKSVYALEPDPASCAKLETFVKALPNSVARRVTILPIAVGEDSGTARFHADGTMGAAVSDDGEIVVACRTLDETFEREDVTYIKMDIEGQEPAALRGARQLLARCRPVLAVCVYHTPEHLWSIPMFLARELDDYRFFLRSHKPDGWDVILYAVPAERAAGS
jgi:FkbM family methyltransferase